MPPVTLVAVRDTQARFGQRTTKKTVDCTKLIIIIIIITFLRFIDNNNGNMTKKSTKAEIKEVKKKHTTVQYCNVVVKDNNDLCYLKCDGRSYELEKKNVLIIHTQLFACSEQALCTLGRVAQRKKIIELKSVVEVAEERFPFLGLSIETF